MKTIYDDPITYGSIHPNNLEAPTMRAFSEAEPATVADTIAWLSRITMMPKPIKVKFSCKAPAGDILFIRTMALTAPGFNIDITATSTGPETFTIILTGIARAVRIFMKTFIPGAEQ